MKPTVGCTIIIRLDASYASLILTRDGLVTHNDNFKVVGQLVEQRSDYSNYAVITNNKSYPAEIYPITIRNPINYRRNIIDANLHQQKSSFGGLGQVVINNGPFVLFSHITELTNLAAIFAHGKLDHSLSLGRQQLAVRGGLTSKFYEGGQHLATSATGRKYFPGVYMRSYSQMYLLSDDFVEDRRTGYCNLLFSKQLLQQRNWHINTADSNGAINNHTFTSETLPSYLDQIPDFWRPDNYSGTNNTEIVFHDAVPLTLLELIVVGTEEDRTMVSNIVMGTVPVLVINKELGIELSQRQFNKITGLTNALPQLCYTNVVHDDYGDVISNATLSDVQTFFNNSPYNNKIYSWGRVEAKEREYIWNKMLQNCNIKEQYSKEREPELFKAIEQRMNDLYFGDTPRIVPDPAPWKYTPNYYKEQLDQHYE